jgi:hypothetical protein
VDGARIAVLGEDGEVPQIPDSYLSELNKVGDNARPWQGSKVVRFRRRRLARGCSDPFDDP